MAAMASDEKQKLLARATPSALVGPLEPRDRSPTPPPSRRQRRTYRTQGHQEAAAPESNDTVQLPPSRGPTSVIGDEISCGVTEFLRRTGISRSHLYILRDQREIESFLSGEKRFIVLQSWFDYIKRQQEAEKRGELFADRGGNRTRLGLTRSRPGVDQDQDQEREPPAGMGARRGRPRRHFPPPAPGA